MGTFNLTYKAFGERSILVEWPQKIDEFIQKDVLNFKNEITKNKPKLIVEIINAYCSLTIKYISTIENINDEISYLKRRYSACSKSQNTDFKLWHIPVCYEREFAPDLTVFSKLKNITIEVIIDRHTKPKYLVNFIGFLPGFLYLSGLDSSLEIPRKSTPEMTVKKGSVGIGGMQTGIYPMDSPGGWYVIGNSPLNFFDVTKNEPCFAKPGDCLKFYSISKIRHLEIENQLKKGSYNLEFEMHHG